MGKFWKKGTRVVAIKDISPGSIRSGTRGVVVEESGAFSYPRIAFEGHKGEFKANDDEIMAN